MEARLQDVKASYTFLISKMQEANLCLGSSDQRL